MAHIHHSDTDGTVIVSDYEERIGKETHAKYESDIKPITDIPLALVGEDGNAFAILGRARIALRRNHRSDLVEKFTSEATNGDYNNLLRTCFKYFIVK